MIQILLHEIGLPRARVFRREPYVVSTLLHGKSSGAIPFQTTPMRGVKRGKPAVFDPPVILMEVEDPGEHISGELLLCDSDEDFRHLAGTLGSVFRDISRGSKLAALLLGVSPGVRIASGLATREALKPAIDAIEERLRQSEDDLLGRFEVFLDSADDFRAGDRITLASTRCFLEIEVRELLEAEEMTTASAIKLLSEWLAGVQGAGLLDLHEVAARIDTDREQLEYDLDLFHKLATLENPSLSDSAAWSVLQLVDYATDGEFRPGGLLANRALTPDPVRLGQVVAHVAEISGEDEGGWTADDVDFEGDLA